MYKKIPKSDEGALRTLIKAVYDDLTRPEFLIPYTETELNNLFNADYALPPDGIYIDGKLVGMAQLYVKQETLSHCKEILDIADKRVVETGGWLIQSAARGHGLLSRLISGHPEAAKTLGFDYIIATTHPENIASIKALKKLGLEYAETIQEGEYLRDIYWMKLN
ncbi:MAG: GNAT family N-acetyltransferase [Alphaproteobacteria bacterium]|nr:GNAT family N-acetyltransferase [Alphaproteobacteria bacterium]